MAPGGGEPMGEAGRTEPLGEVLNLRQLLHYTVEKLWTPESDAGVKL